MPLIANPGRFQRRRDCGNRREPAERRNQRERRGGGDAQREVWTAPSYRKMPSAQPTNRGMAMNAAGTRTPQRMNDALRRGDRQKCWSSGKETGEARRSCDANKPSASQFPRGIPAAHAR